MNNWSVHYKPLATELDVQKELRNKKKERERERARDRGREGDNRLQFA